MIKSIGLAVIGILCSVTTTAFACPPARNMGDESPGVHCFSTCVVRVTPHPTRAALYGTVFVRCHQKSLAAVRWGTPAGECAQTIQVARCN